MRILRTSFALWAVICLLGCGKQIFEPGADSRMIVENDEAVLNTRLNFDDKELLLEPTEGEDGVRNKSSSSQLKLKLRARLSPPEVDGMLLHASHVTVEGNRAYVSYSTINATYRGGAEIIDVSRINNPKVRSQVLFRDTDVAIAKRSGDKIYLGGATDYRQSSSFDSPAVMEIIGLKSSKFSRQNQRLNMPSNNANDIAIFDETIHVTVGSSNGRLCRFDIGNLRNFSEREVDGAKAVAYSDDYIIVMEGTGANLHLFDRQTGEFVKIINIGCDNYLEAKAEIQVVGNKVYASAWECGMKVVDIPSGSVVDDIPVAPGSQCNAVSVNGDYVYMANGTDGVQISRITENGFVNVGTAGFRGSTNFVLVRNNIMFVANGESGLLIIEIED